MAAWLGRSLPSGSRTRAGDFEDDDDNDQLDQHERLFGVCTEDMLVLPFKVVFAGGEHVAAPLLSAEESADLAQVVRGNELLLDQDAVDYYAAWLPRFAGRRARLYSTWLTEELGLVLVQDPVAELAMRLYRAARRRDAGFRDHRRLSGRRLRRLVTDFSRAWGASPSIYAAGDEDCELLENMRRLFTAYAEDPDFLGERQGPAEEAHARWAELGRLCLGAGTFWGLCWPGQSEGQPGPLPAVSPELPQAHGAPAAPLCRSVDQLRLFVPLLHGRYLETLLGAPSLSAEQLREYCRVMALPQPQPGYRGSRAAQLLPERGLLEDVERAVNIKKRREGGVRWWRRWQLLFGLYLLLGNGLNYRSFGPTT